MDNMPFQGSILSWERFCKLLTKDRKALFGLTCLFLFGIALGRLLPILFPPFANEFTQLVLNRFDRIARLAAGSPLFVRVLVIWVNNLLAALTAIISGLLFGPLLPLLLLFGNGAIIGLFQPLFTATPEVSPLQYYLGLLPHGIFELPALFMAVWVGIRFGLITFYTLRGYLRRSALETVPVRWVVRVQQYFQTEAKDYMIFIILMLFIAAVLETTISPYLIYH